MTDAPSSINLHNQIPDPSGEKSSSSMLSSESKNAVGNAFDTLREPVVEESERGRVLRDLAVEAIQPILREWLDEHLPKIVERLVAEEIERLSRLR